MRRRDHLGSIPAGAAPGWSSSMSARTGVLFDAMSDLGVAPRDIKGKRAGMPVYQLFRGE